MHKLVLLAVLTGLSMLSRVPSAAAQSIVHFCGEVLPANQPVVARLWAQVLSRQASQAAYLNTLKQRAMVVFPVIEPIIAQYDIPADFKYLLLVESGGQNNTVSSRGAAGFWQLMPGTARLLGLSTARNHDERYDLRKSTSAACRYLRELHEQMGSWTLVAAAYNAGPNYVHALQRRFPTHHALALPYQSAATKSYVFQAVALKELLTNPQSYPTYLNEQTIARLSEGNSTVSETERMALLMAVDSEPETVEADSAQMAVTSQQPVTDLTGPPVTVAAAPRLETRSVSGGSLAEGQLRMFEVIRPSVINGVTVSVGDLIYAHVETLDAATGRVFLRTEKVVSAQTQETTKLQLVAVEKTRQPGVSTPARDAMESGWKLSWESL